MQARPLAQSILLMTVTVVAGLAVRFVHVGLPYFVTKYAGSMLWAVMIYWVVSTILFSWRIRSAFILSGVLATAVEFFKLYHSAKFDAFRLTLPGVLLLGRFFSVWDIVAYWIAIACGAWIDEAIRD
jgi:hypothetical protein